MHREELAQPRGRTRAFLSACALGLLVSLPIPSPEMSGAWNLLLISLWLMVAGLAWSAWFKPEMQMVFATAAWLLSMVAYWLGKLLFPVVFLSILGLWALLRYRRKDHSKSLFVVCLFLICALLQIPSVFAQGALDDMLSDMEEQQQESPPVQSEASENAQARFEEPSEKEKKESKMNESLSRIEAEMEAAEALDEGAPKKRRRRPSSAKAKSIVIDSATQPEEEEQVSQGEEVDSAVESLADTAADVVTDEVLELEAKRLQELKKKSKNSNARKPTELPRETLAEKLGVNESENGGGESDNLPSNWVPESARQTNPANIRQPAVAAALDERDPLRGRLSLREKSRQEMVKKRQKLSVVPKYMSGYEVNDLVSCGVMDKIPWKFLPDGRKKRLLLKDRLRHQTRTTFDLWELFQVMDREGYVSYIFRRPLGRGQYEALVIKDTSYNRIIVGSKGSKTVEAQDLKTLVNRPAITFYHQNGSTLTYTPSASGRSALIVQQALTTGRLIPPVYLRGNYCDRPEDEINSDGLNREIAADAKSAAASPAGAAGAAAK